MARRQPEKLEQAQIVRLLQSVGGAVYVLGTRRARRCHACGSYSKDMGTRQTPGIGDLYAFLPAPKWRLEGRPIALWVEAKAEKGRPSDDQVLFEQLCRETGVAHVMGGVNAVAGFLVRGGWVREVAHYRQPQGDARL